jgi:predicted RNase H-like nuclease (RuvC/YqgF family)
MPKGKQSITTIEKNIAHLQERLEKRKQEIAEDRRPLEKTIASLQGEVAKLEKDIAPLTKQLEEKKQQLDANQAELDKMLGVKKTKSGGTRTRLTDEEKAEVENIYKAKVKEKMKKGEAKAEARAEVLAKRK